MSTTIPRQDRFVASIETQQLTERLRKAEPGETIPYGELSAIVSTSVQADRGRGWLTSARKRVERDDGIVFDAVHNEGLRRRTNEDFTPALAKDVEKNRRQARRAMRRAACCDIGTLDADSALRYHADVTRLGMIEHIASENSRKRLTQAVEKRQGQLPWLAGMKTLTNGDESN